MRNERISYARIAAQELREGAEPFDVWAVNVRCLKGIEFDSLPVKRIHGSRITPDL